MDPDPVIIIIIIIIIIISGEYFYGRLGPSRDHASDCYIVAQGFLMYTQN